MRVINIHIREDQVEAADRIAAWLSEKTGGTQITRSAIIRMALDSYIIDHQHKEQTNEQPTGK